VNEIFSLFCGQSVSQGATIVLPGLSSIVEMSGRLNESWLFPFSTLSLDIRMHCLKATRSQPSLDD
jgi:hypothetical protein